MANNRESTLDLKNFPLSDADNLLASFGNMPPDQFQSLYGGLIPQVPGATTPVRLPGVTPEQIASLGAVQPRGPIDMSAVTPRPGAASAIQGAPTTPAAPLGRPLLGRIGHTLADIGKGIGIGAGTAFTPNLMPWIPGTPQHAAAENLAEQRRQQTEAQVGREEAQAAQTRAQAEIGIPARAELERAEAARGVKKSPIEQAFEAQLDPNMPPEQKAQVLDAFRKVTEIGAEARPEHMERVTLIGPDGKPFEANFHPATGEYTDAAGNVIPNPVKAPPERVPSDINQYTQDWLASQGLEDTPENRLKAHAAFTKETKTDPGVARIQILGQFRGMPVTDEEVGTTAPMSWADYNRLSKQFPGRFTAPAYTPEVASEMATARGLAPVKTGQQVQSYGTFIRHTGDLYNAIDTLRNTQSPLMNRPLNWLRANAGQPEIKAFLAKLDPVQKEFESFLLSNRALYADDREVAHSLINENFSPAQMYAVLPSLVHTGTARLEELNAAYQRATGKDIPDLVSPEAQEVFKRMKVEGPKTMGAAQPEGGAPAVGTVEAGYRFKGGNPADAKNWEKVK